MLMIALGLMSDFGVTLAVGFGKGRLACRGYPHLTCDAVLTAGLVDRCQRVITLPSRLSDEPPHRVCATLATQLLILRTRLLGADGGRCAR